ncbi:MAG TPA: response regulator transcription factor [Streptosporangiaceae bacterium]|nr:response regulator transcription factor [Streptosporangiaceae bacterium]
MNREPGPLRLVIIDDHQMVLDGLKAMLHPYSDQVEILGESSEPQHALRLVGEVHPEIVLLDIRLRGSSGLDLCGDILAAQPDCKVVFLTVYDDEQYLYQALRVGAAGFLLKRIRGAELVDFLRRICDGEVLIDPALAGRVALSAARLHSGEFWPGAHLGLTQRESEVLALLVAGLSNRAIAAKLVVGEETVKTHSRGIYRKLGVSDRAGAVAAALREGVFH